jgi:hypothetical protein
MKKCLLILALCLGSRSAFAAPSSVWWRQWSVSSSEELSLGTKYTSYPLPLMLDGDPKTAWVYSATSKEFSKEDFKSRYGVELNPEKPVWMDGLRLMNGQNESRARFYRNNRAVQIRVTLDVIGKGISGKDVVKTVKLPDSMGWHQVSLPRRLVKDIKIEFTKIRSGPENDLCISELELSNQGHKVDWHLPRLVMYTDGQEGCRGLSLINHNGKALAYVTEEMGYTDAWSRNGRYVAGIESDPERLWVADVSRGRIINRNAQKSVLKTYGINVNGLTFS